jgi:hypothetical protein
LGARFATRGGTLGATTAAAAAALGLGGLFFRGRLGGDGFGRGGLGGRLGRLGSGGASPARRAAMSAGGCARCLGLIGLVRGTAGCGWVERCLTHSYSTSPGLVGQGGRINARWWGRLTRKRSGSAMRGYSARREVIRCGRLHVTGGAFAQRRCVLLRQASGAPRVNLNVSALLGAARRRSTPPALVRRTAFPDGSAALSLREWTRRRAHSLAQMPADRLYVLAVTRRLW